MKEKSWLLKYDLCFKRTPKCTSEHKTFWAASDLIAVMMAKDILKSEGVTNDGFVVYLFNSTEKKYIVNKVQETVEGNMKTIRENLDAISAELDKLKDQLIGLKKARSF